MKARQTPTFERREPFTSTDGKQAAALAAAFFGEPLEWQRYVLDVFCARNKHDKYAYPVIGLSVPRQNGKSWDVLARVFYGMVSSAEHICYTCQLGSTANEMFRRLAQVFESDDNPELKDLLKAVRRANGQQAIYLNNGALVRFSTRTDSFARGESYDILIYDEAQDLTQAQQEATLPIISASPTHNTQTIYLGTPQNPQSLGTVFRTLHADVHESKGDITWLEWGVPEIKDKHDKRWWYETNPSLGALIEESAIEVEANTLTDAGFARERLCYFAPYKSIGQPAIDIESWDKQGITAIGGAFNKKTALGVKFSADGATYAIAGCKQDAQGRSAFEVVEFAPTSRGTQVIAEALAKRVKTVSCVVIDGISGADALCTHLDALKVPKGYVLRTSAKDVIESAGLLIDGLKDGSLFHTKGQGQKALEEAAKSAVRRSIGARGGFGFGTSGTTPIEPLEASALALFGIKKSKRNPRRKQAVF